MKICYLANAQSVHTQRWAKHFHLKGHQVAVISFDPAKIEGVMVIPLKRFTSQRHLNVLLNLPYARRLVQKVRPDILHAQYVTSYGLAGALAGWRPLVMTAWGSDVFVMPENSWTYRQIVRFVLGRADLITSMAPHMTEHLVERGYAAAGKILTLPFGVDTDVFNLNCRTRPHVDQPSIVVSTRRPDYRMDVDTFVKAVPAVLKEYGNTQFIITGEGPLRKKLEMLASDLGIAGHVTFRGEISHQDMPELLGMTDVFVSTPPTDGNNISLNEAMACGVFPIATDIPANIAWIRSGKNGLLYPCRDVDKLSACIIEALRRPNWRNDIMSENWEIVCTKASWSKNMARMEDYYFLLNEKRCFNDRTKEKNG